MQRRVDGSAIEVITLSVPEPATAFVPTVVPSVNPTLHPDFDVSGLAMRSLAFDSLANLPLDLAVPARIEGADLAGLDHATLFVLMHVDGQSPIAVLAKTAQMPVREVIDRFRILLERGVVAMGSRPPVGAAPPYSGVYRRYAGE